MFSQALLPDLAPTLSAALKIEWDYIGTPFIKSSECSLVQIFVFSWLFALRARPPMSSRSSTTT